MNVTFMSLGVRAAAGWRGTGDTGDTGAWRLGADGARGGRGRGPHGLGRRGRAAIASHWPPHSVDDRWLSRAIHVPPGL